MITWALENFINSRVEQGEISRSDLRVLQRDVLPNGIGHRDEADVLIALDRAVHDKDPAWDCFITKALVAYVVWTCRPTGRVDRETAEWLIQSLACGAGPTDTAISIAFEIVRECEEADEALVAFVMRWSSKRARNLPDVQAEYLF
jgi:hypothetical protein